MTIFLILAPFGSFALLMLVTSAEISLFAAAAICLAVIAHRRRIAAARSRCSAPAPSSLFAATRRLRRADRSDLSHSAVKLAVDIGVLAISLASMHASASPFILQYALEEVRCRDREAARLPEAIYIITWAWTGAFAADDGRPTC